MTTPTPPPPAGPIADAITGDRITVRAAQHHVVISSEPTECWLNPGAALALAHQLLDAAGKLADA